MIDYKYAYLLVVTDNNGVAIKYDYLLSNYILFYNSAVYSDLSGIDLCRYDLHNKQDNEDFFNALNGLEFDVRTNKIDILFELACGLSDFLEVE